MSKLKNKPENQRRVPRSDPKLMRELAEKMRVLALSSNCGDESLVFWQVSRELESAAVDVETMAEDLELEREMVREMAANIALSNPPKVLG